MEFVEKSAVKTTLTFSEKLSDLSITDLNIIFDVIDSMDNASVLGIEDCNELLEEIQGLSTSIPLRSYGELTVRGVRNKTASEIKTEIINIISKYVTKLDIERKRDD